MLRGADRAPLLRERFLASPPAMVFAVGFLVALPVMAIGELGARDGRERFHQEAIASADESAQRGAAVVRAHLGEITRLVVVLAERSPELRRLFFTGDKGPAQTVLDTYLLGRPGSRPEMAAYWIADGRGNFVLGRSVTPGRGSTLLKDGDTASIADLPFFQETIRRGTDAPGTAPSQADAVLSEGLPRIIVAGTESVGPTVSFFIPPPTAGAPSGALVVQLRPEEIAGWLRGQVGTDGELYLVTGNGLLIGRTSGPGGTGTDISRTLLFARAKAGAAPAGDWEDPLGGGTRVVAVDALRDVGWYVIASFGPTRAERDLAASLDQQRAVRIGLVALLLIATYLFARVAAQVVRQRRALAESLERQTALGVELTDKSGQLEVANHQLAQASQNKSEFLANMSHELRTPLNAVIGFSDVLLEGMFGQVNERQREYLNDILTSGKHLLSLVNDILDLSKVEAGKMELQRSVFSLRELVESGATMVREQAIKQRIALSVDIEPDLAPVVADERKVKQVLFNLLSNAVKFTPAGGRIEVRARPVDGEIQVSVHDTGAGIAPEDQSRIFEEFQQTEAGARTEESTGLGLTLAKRFMELHGGRLWVESEVGRGSTFTLALPLRPVDAGEPVAMPQADSQRR